MVPLRVLYASDLHGSDAVFRKFIQAVQIYHANVAIVGGDVTGRGIVPILFRGNGKYEAWFVNHLYLLTTRDERKRFRQAVADAGLYPLELQADEAHAFEEDQSFNHCVTERLVNERVRNWLELAEGTLTKWNVQFFFMAGDEDEYSVDEVIRAFPFVRNHDGRRYSLDDEHEMIGLACGNGHSRTNPRDVPEEEIADRIDELAQLLAKPSSAVFSFHAPPFGSLIDLAVPGGAPSAPRNGDMRNSLKPLGSTAVRAAIERTQPLLGLHGHLHTSAGFCRIGRTLCVNPGSEYADGVMRAALLDLEIDRVKSYTLLSS